MTATLELTYRLHQIALNIEYAIKEDGKMASDAILQAEWDNALTDEESDAVYSALESWGAI